MFTTDLDQSSGYESWVAAQTRFAEQSASCQQIFLHCGHNLHYVQSDFIAQKIMEYMKEKQ
jgi:hypothetical protein